MPSDDAFADLRAADRARTPGEWRQDGTRLRADVIESAVGYSAVTADYELARTEWGRDAEFVARCSVDVPKLLAENERLRLILSIEHGDEVYTGTPANEHLIAQFGRDVVLREHHTALLADLHELADEWTRTAVETEEGGIRTPTAPIRSFADHLRALIAQHGGEA